MFANRLERDAGLEIHLGIAGRTTRDERRKTRREIDSAGPKVVGGQDANRRAVAGRAVARGDGEVREDELRGNRRRQQHDC